MTAQELYEEYEAWMKSVFHTLDNGDQSLLVSISLRLENMMHAETFLEESIRSQAEEVKAIKHVICERYSRQ